MYIRRRLAQRGFLIIGTSVSHLLRLKEVVLTSSFFWKVPWPWSRSQKCKGFLTAIFLLCHAIWQKIVKINFAAFGNYYQTHENSSKLIGAHQSFLSELILCSCDVPFHIPGISTWSNTLVSQWFRTRCLMGRRKVALKSTRKTCAHGMGLPWWR